MKARGKPLQNCSELLVFREDREPVFHSEEVVKIGHRLVNLRSQRFRVAGYDRGGCVAFAGHWQ